MLLSGGPIVKFKFSKKYAGEQLETRYRLEGAEDLKYAKQVPNF